MKRGDAILLIVEMLKGEKPYRMLDIAVVQIQLFSHTTLLTKSSPGELV